jgi:hypothetical protein
MEHAQRVTIRVACTPCGERSVDPHVVTIRNCVETDDWSYWFVCPACGTRGAATTSAPSALSAICAGSRFETWSLPAELAEHRAGAPLTLVDLLELRLLLIEPDWIEQLL